MVSFLALEFSMLAHASSAPRADATAALVAALATAAEPAAAVALAATTIAQPAAAVAVAPAAVAVAAATLAEPAAALAQPAVAIADAAAQPTAAVPFGTAVAVAVAATATLRLLRHEGRSPVVGREVGVVLQERAARLPPPAVAVALAAVA